MFSWLAILPLRIRQWFWPTAHRMLLGIRQQTSWGEGSLLAARATIGWGEEGGNNRGSDVVRLRRGKAGHGAWCAAAVSYWIENAWMKLSGSKVADLKKCPFKRTHGARKLWKRVATLGSIVHEPKPGDIVLWSRGKGWMGHVGIVSRVNGNWFRSVEGNRGSFPSTVREYAHEIGEPGLLGFARLPELPNA